MLIPSKKVTISLILKFAIVLSAAAGVTLSALASSKTFMGGSVVFMYFTIQSNIAIALVSLIGSFLLIRGKPVGNVWYVIKYVATVSITLTGVVFIFVLAPILGGFAWELQNILTHVVVPLAAIIDFFVTGPYGNIKKSCVFFVTLPPLAYAIYAGIGYVAGWEFSKGTNYPYFFLNWGSPAGAFGFTKGLPFMGCGWWILALMFLLIAVGFVYLAINDALKKAIAKRKYGMCFVYYYTRDALDSHTVAVEMEKLNIESVRIWSHFCWVLNRDLTVNRKIADGYHELYRELKTHGVREIVGMSHYWFLPEEKYGTKDCSLCYDRDTRPGSKYQLFLDLFEESWFRLASEFPEVNAWEIGNELNHKVFLKRIDGTDFSWKERIDIATDMMFRGTRGVRRANPSAKVIMPGLAPVNRNSEGVIMGSIAAEYDGIIDSIKETYANIRSGEFGSTHPRDFFDALAWHPYYAKQASTGEWFFCEPDEEWVDLNRRIYQVAVDAGDEGVECYLTEYGQNDWGIAEEDKKLVSFVKKGYSLIRNELPFVTTVHAYRFCDSMGYAGDFLDNYAFYHLENGHLSAKQRTYELQRQYGGTGTLSE